MTTPKLSRPFPKAASGTEPVREALAPPSFPTTGEFLAEFFAQLQEQAIDYAVLRNYQGLPEKPGRDIDLLTADYAGVVAILLETARRAGSAARIFRKYDGMDKFHLVRWCRGLEVLEIDVAWAIRWKGISLVSADLLESCRRPCQGFFTLCSGAEAAISLMKQVMYHGTVPEKYKPQLARLAGADRAGFFTALSTCFGDALVTKLFDLTCQSNWQGIETLVPELRRQAAARALTLNPPEQILRWLNFIWLNLLKFLRPSGRFVVLIGPDGSGKSTISQKLQDYLQPLFQGSRYFHGHFMIIPRLGDLAKLIGVNPSEKSSVIRPDPQAPGEQVIEFGWLRSCIYLFYYSLGYLLGHGMIFRVRGRGELVIFDRYYYDYLIQPGMSLPAWLIMMVLHLLPKPDLVVYLRNDPQVILSRKPELTLKELVRQGEVCSRLIHRLPQGRVVETTGSPDDTTAKVAKMLVDTMFPRGLTPPAEPAIPQMGAGIS